jgi:hypothetical protein
MKNQIIGHILQTEIFTGKYRLAVSFALSNKANFYMKTKNAKQITDLSRFQLRILKITTSSIHMIEFRVQNSRFNNENRERINR